MSASLREIARALGGENVNGEVLAPGPHHSPQDRSLSVKIAESAPDGLLIHSFAGDDPIVCKDYVRAKLGMPQWKSNGSNGNAATYQFDFRDPKTGATRYSKIRHEYADKPKKIYFKPAKRGGSGPLLYGGERLAHLAEGQPVWIVEGENKVDALWARGEIAVSCDCGAKSNWLPDHAKLLRGRKIILWPDSDEPGETYVANAATALRAENPKADIRVVRPFGIAHGDEKGRDVCDWAGSEVEFATLAASAVPFKSHSNGDARPAEGDSAPIELDAEIARLSKLKTGEYERERKGVAGSLGLRTVVLDKLVKDARPVSAGQGRALDLKEPEPWPSQVNGTELICELTAAILRYVVIAEQDALACALWVLHTYCFDSFECTPRLAITAPEKQCGKTTLLDVIGCLVPRPLPTTNITTPAVFRTVEMSRPSLLIDEADTFLGENEELRGILNSGHRRGGQVIRTVGDDFEPRAFSTHCPVAIAQIGKLPDTLADRSIAILMKRRAPGEKVTRFRMSRTAALADLARKAKRWVADHTETIRNSDPDIPEAIYNRAADNWEPLLAVADAVGGDVPDKVREAALAACGVEKDLNFSTMLLADIREAFAERNSERLASEDLVAALVAMKDRPWGECNHGKALTQNGLARRLKPYEIRPADMRVGGLHIKGYNRADFADAFSRYLLSTPIDPRQPRQYNDFNKLGKNRSATESFSVADEKGKIHNTFNDVAVVADEKPLNGESKNADGQNAPRGPGWRLKI